METRLGAVPALTGTLEVNPRDAVRPTVQKDAEQWHQNVKCANFTTRQRVADGEEFGKFFCTRSFDSFIERNARGRQ